MSISHELTFISYSFPNRCLQNSDKPVFGQYAFAGPSGVTLRVGDEVDIIERA